LEKNKMNLLDTIKDSLVENFYPEGWDLARIDECASNRPQDVLERQPFWNEDFQPDICSSVTDFEVMMGHEIAMEIQNASDDNVELALITPVGPMGMYRWVVYFLKQWNTSCGHVTVFSMDEWSDAEGNTLPSEDDASFSNAMNNALYTPLRELTVPEGQRNFATRHNLPLYAEKIAGIKRRGGRLVTIYGIGRVFHIAFWEPHFAAEFSSEDEWKRQTHRLGAKLHPLTIEQNAITSFKSRYTMVPARANTIGPGLFLQSDRMIGGCDGILGRGMQWQGASLWVTLRYGPDIWVPSSFVPTIPGKLFFVRELAGPLEAECN
jgi:glucosamine-6-phosphate deaminase